MIPPLTPLPAARLLDHGMMVDQWEQWQEARGNYIIGVQVYKIVRCNNVYNMFLNVYIRYTSP